MLKCLSGFALGFIFLSPPFSPIRFFLCHFLELRARFWPFFAQKEPGLGKCLLSLTPFILVDYCTHIDKITKEESILYLKRLTVFKFMYICTWRLLIFLNRANTDEMLFGYSLLAKVPVCKYSQ